MSRELKGLPVLETERLILRKMLLDDVEDMFAYASNSDVARYVTWPAHKSIKETRDFLGMMVEQYQDPKFVNWAIVEKESSRMIGTVGYVKWDQNNNWGELGYALSKDFWGNGYMPEATKAVIDFGFEHMGLNRVQARCWMENNCSERVMQKVGMNYEGIQRQIMFVKGAYRDLKLYAIVKEDWSKE